MVNFCSFIYTAALDKTVMSSSSSVQFSYNSVSAGRSIILLNIKCHQLSKPEVTVARNPNSIRGQNGEQNISEALCFSPLTFFFLRSPNVSWKCVYTVYHECYVSCHFFFCVHMLCVLHAIKCVSYARENYFLAWVLLTKAAFIWSKHSKNNNVVEILLWPQSHDP